MFRPTYYAAAAAAALLLSGCAAVQGEHRHGAGPGAGPGAGAGRMAMMDDKMKNMRGMHEKVMRAKTPEERRALMQDHMKSMREGMGMMEGMSSMRCMEQSEAQCHEMMEKRMEMMQSMMQMMMEHLPNAAAR